MRAFYNGSPSRINLFFIAFVVVVVGSHCHPSHSHIAAAHIFLCICVIYEGQYLFCHSIFVFVFCFVPLFCQLQNIFDFCLYIHLLAPKNIQDKKESNLSKLPFSIKCACVTFDLNSLYNHSIPQRIT